MALTIIQLVPLVTLASDPGAVQMAGIGERVCAANSAAALSWPMELRRAATRVSIVQEISHTPRPISRGAGFAPAPGGSVASGTAEHAQWSDMPMHASGPAWRTSRQFPIDPGDGAVPASGTWLLFAVCAAGAIRRKRPARSGCPLE
ncbi:MAG: hypothetical protein J0L78_05465 [Planctomycetes bacterium]|nr:hypothetical protein [Planctomycetota bacterium]